MRRLGFSLNYPNYHPKKGQKTYFVEKVWKSMYDAPGFDLRGYWENYNKFFPITSDIKENIHNHEPKLTTIRAGHKWKAGDWFQPFCWSGRPYWSKPILFAPPIQIVKTWKYEVKCPQKGVEQWFINDTLVSESNEYMQGWFNAGLIEEIAKNDGLELVDFLNWIIEHPDFKKTNKFSGQILTWSNEVEY